MGVLTNASILVTGAGGFLGRHTVAALERAGAFVVPSHRSGHDLRYESDALEAVLLAQPDLVVNLAAAPELTPPGLSFKSMLSIGMNVLHAAAVARARVIQIHRASPDNYIEANIQRALVALSNAYHTQYGSQVSHLILSELYGPLDHSDRGAGRTVMHVFSSVAEAKKKESKIAKATGQKDFSTPLLYVEDAVAAIVKACVADTCPLPIEISGASVSLEKLGELCARTMEYSGTVEWNGAHRDSAPSRGTSGEEALEWTPSVSLEVGIRNTAQWFIGKDKSEEVRA